MKKKEVDYKKVRDFYESERIKWGIKLALRNTASKFRISQSEVLRTI